MYNRRDLVCGVDISSAVALLDETKVPIHKAVSMADMHERKGDTYHDWSDSPSKIAQDKVVLVVTHAIICMEMEGWLI